VLPEWSDANRRTIFVGTTHDLTIPEYNRPIVRVQKPNDQKIMIVAGWPLWDASEATLEGLHRDYFRGALMFRDYDRDQLFAVVMSLDVYKSNRRWPGYGESDWAYKARCTLLEIPPEYTMVLLQDITETVEGEQAPISLGEPSVNVSSSSCLALPGGILVHAEFGLKELLFRQEFTLTVEVEIGEESSWREHSENKQQVSQLDTDIEPWLAYMTKAKEKNDQLAASA
jgi:hypothetical protein